ncbi:MAG: DUF4270 family protein [Putridiphycobacter sp.]
MTKIKKEYNWRRVVKLSVSFFSLLIIFAACKKEEATVGGTINPNGLNIITSDTFTVNTYSIALDSIATDETSISLLGVNNDPEFGLTDCGIVTQIRLSSESPNFGDVANINVDSVVLSLKYSSILKYGNIHEMTFEVFEISDQLDVEDEYYHVTPVTTTGSNLVKAGTGTITPNIYGDVVVGSDTLDPQLRLNLEPSFGDYLIANSAEMSSNDNFTSFFKGLYIKVSNPSSFAVGQGTILYISAEDVLSQLVIYYTNNAEPKTYTFNINSKCARYNKIDVDRTGTPVEAVLNNPNLGNDRFYLQGTLIRPQIEFPYIQDLYKDGNVVINKAELIVPIQDYEEDQFPPSTALFFGEVVDDYVTGFVKDYPSFSAVTYDEDNKQFKFLLTLQIQAILNGERENTGVRLFPTDFFGSTIQRTIFNGPKATLKDKTKLEITYTKY